MDWRAQRSGFTLPEAGWRAAAEFAATAERFALARNYAARHLMAPGAAPMLPDDAPDAALLQLAAVLSAVAPAEAHWRTLGRPVAWLHETLADIGIWARHHHTYYGAWGLRWIGTGWIARQLRGEVARFGRLQGEAARDHAGRPVIGLHIPEDGPLDIGACRRSFARMIPYFREYYPDHDYVGATCESWFLDPEILRLLPPDANLRRFAALGELYACHEPSDAVFRVFGPHAAERGLDGVPCTSRLQCALADFIQGGGVLRTGGLFISRDRFERLAREEA